MLEEVIDACAESVRETGIGEPPAEYAKAVLRALVAMPVDRRMEAMGMHRTHDGLWEEA